MNEEDRDTVLFTVSPEVAQAAIAQVASCESCNPDADWPFDAILDRVMLFSGVHTDYVVVEPPVCPRCRHTVTEKTLVEWAGGIEIVVDGAALVIAPIRTGGRYRRSFFFTE